MRPLVVLFFSFTLVSNGESVPRGRVPVDGLWTAVQSVPFSSESSPPTAYAGARLDLADLLRRIVDRSGQAAMQLPLPDGAYSEILVRIEPSVAPEIAAVFPELESYRFESTDGKFTGRLAVGPGGVYFVGRGADRLLRVEPVQTARGVFYVSYFNRDRTDTALIAAKGSAR